MKKKFYIIPGWEESPTEKQYKDLANVARKKGYSVVLKKIDWKKPLSSQIFNVSKNSTIFGFSLGAILAWLLAQKKSCEHIILASMTPHYSFTNKKIKNDLAELVGLSFVNDLIKNLDSKHKAKKQTIIYGELEKEPGDILIKNTEHELTKDYIEEVAKLL